MLNATQVKEGAFVVKMPIGQRGPKTEGLTTFPLTFKWIAMAVAAEHQMSMEAYAEAARHIIEIDHYRTRNPALDGQHPWTQIDREANEAVKLAQQAAVEAAVPGPAIFKPVVVELLGRYLLKFSRQVIIECDAHVLLKSSAKQDVRIVAGQSPLSSRWSLEIPERPLPDDPPVGISTHCCSENPMHKGSDMDFVVAVSDSLSMAAAFAIGAGEKLTQGESFADIHRWADMKGQITSLILFRGDLVFKRGQIGVVGI